MSRQGQAEESVTIRGHRDYAEIKGIRFSGSERRLLFSQPTQTAEYRGFCGCGGESDPETYFLQKKRHFFEFLRIIAHLRSRTNTLGAVFRVRNASAAAIHRFFQERGFLWIHSPIIAANDWEGAGEIFRVTNFNLEDIPKTDKDSVDYSQDFFGSPAYLTVSGQLQAEVMAMFFENVYTFGPTFRAENSNTSRHLAEFWMVEPEMAFCDLGRSF